MMTAGFMLTGYQLTGWFVVLTSRKRSCTIPIFPPAPNSRVRAQLLRSTLIAATTAAALLVTTSCPPSMASIRPASGASWVSPQMGEIKAQLAQEAEQDRLLDQGGTPAAPQAPAAPDQRSSLMDMLLSQIVIEVGLG